MSTQSRYKFDPVTQRYTLLTPQERALNEYATDGYGNFYLIKGEQIGKPVGEAKSDASGIRSLDVSGGGDNFSAPSGSTGPGQGISPTAQAIGIGLSSYGQALGGLLPYATFSNFAGQGIMGQQVDAMADAQANLSAMDAGPGRGMGIATVSDPAGNTFGRSSPESIAAADLATFGVDEVDDTQAAISAALASMSTDPTVSVSDPAPAAAPGGYGDNTSPGDSPSDAPSDAPSADAGGGYGDNTSPGDSPSDGGPTGEKEGGLISMKRYADGGMTMSPQYSFAPTMPSMSDMPLGMTNQNMFSGMEGQNMPPSMMDQNMFPGVMGQNMSGMMDQTMPQMNFKKGGIASLPDVAERVRRRGRGGDTILAHINPEEAGILKLLGGSGAINPHTGLPEFGLLSFLSDIPVVGKVYDAFSSVGKEIERGVEGIAKALGPVGQIAAAYFGGPIGAALYAGLAPEGSSFDVKRAALAGGLTYGANALSGSANPLAPKFDYSGAFGGGAAPITTPNLTPDLNADAISQLSAEQVNALQPDASSVSQAVPSPAQITSGSTPIQPFPGEGSVFDFSRAGAPAPNVVLSPTTSTPAAATSAASGVGSLAGTVGETALSYGADALKYAVKNPVQTAFMATQIKAAMEAKKELDKQKEEAERILAEQEKYSAEQIAFAEDVMRKYPTEYRRLTAEDVKSKNLAGGGLAGLNAFKAGGSPRFLKGKGDGMSDDIPAMIGNQQKAALSDGEFVVPADVVSHLGNGSSRAGAKKLYAMMDNIRQARTGKKRQAPEVKPYRYMPA